MELVSLMENWSNKNLKCYMCGETRSVKYVRNGRFFCNKCVAFAKETYDENTSKYLFHLSYEDNLRILYPRYVENAAANEPDIERICFSKDILGCFVAIDLYKFSHGLQTRRFLYRTKEKITDFKIPYRVRDSALTEEVWMTEPVEVELVAEFHPVFMTTIPNGSRGSLDDDQIGEAFLISEILNRSTITYKDYLCGELGDFMQDTFDSLNQKYQR